MSTPTAVPVANIRPRPVHVGILEPGFLDMLLAGEVR